MQSLDLNPLCALHGTRVEWGGWEWATEGSEDSWGPR